MRHHLLTFCIGIIAANGTVVAQDVPAQAAFETALEAEIREKVENPYQLAANDLRERYLAALGRELMWMQNAGKLNEALAVKAENERFASGKPLPATDDRQTLPEVQKLRATFRAALQKLQLDRAKQLQPYLGAYQREMAALAGKLTKEGRLAEAESAKAAIQRQSFFIQFSAPAAISCKGEAIAFEDGAKAYSNRDYFWQNVPASLAGLRFLQNAGGRGEGRNINVKVPGVVYVACMDVSRQGHPGDHEALGKLGFEKTAFGFSYSTSRPTTLSVYQKFVDTSLSLPAANSWTGYVVIGDIR